MADLSDQIEQAAADPASVSVDGQSVSARPIPEQIAADQYLAGKAAARKRRRGLSFTQLTTPGAMPDGGRAADGTGGFA